MKNLLLSKKLKRSETRILIIDDNQIRFNEIENIFKAQTHSVKALLLDDIKNFEKQLNFKEVEEKVLAKVNQPSMEAYLAMLTGITPKKALVS